MNTITKHLTIKMVQLAIKYQYFTYYPKYFSKISFDDIYAELKDKCHTYNFNIKGKIYEAKRYSCVFSNCVEKADAQSKVFSYTQLDCFSWESSPLIEYIKTKLEMYLNTNFDYCLAHYYGNGQKSINWHNDRESIKKDVVSVSFGATRKFRFREIGQKQGWIKEFHLAHGDVFHMLGGCQEEFEHCVPVEKCVLEPRINLTFRKNI
jgi:hypothetical protein